MATKTTWHSPPICRNFDKRLNGMDIFHENIRRVRRDMHLSQEEIADRMGIQRSTYGNFERGKTNLLCPNMVKFSEAVGLTAEEILCAGSSGRGGFLNEGDLEDRLYDLSEELKAQRRIIEALSGKIDKLVRQLGK